MDTIYRMVGTVTSVYLFGSRLDDQARGGEVDLHKALQRCVYVLDASSWKLEWPLTDERLEMQKRM